MKMKKKILISITAVVLAVCSLFVFTACERQEAPAGNGIKKGMTAGEIVEYLMKTDVKSMTGVRGTPDGSMTEYMYFTDYGYCNRRVTPEGETLSFKIKDGTRFIEIDIQGDEKNVVVTELGDGKMIYGTPEATLYEAVTFAAMYVLGGDYLYKNEIVAIGEGEMKYSVESGKITYEYSGMVGSVYDINNTTLPLPDEFKDYHSLATTQGNYNFSDVTFELDGETIEGKEFTGTNHNVYKTIIPAEVDGKPVVSVNGDSYHEIVIPASVRRICQSLEYIVNEDGGIYYSGTQEQWKQVELMSKNWNKDVIVHCSDGDVIVEKYVYSGE